MLAGGEGVIYEVTLKGQVGTAYQRLSQQAWVTGIQSKPVKDTTHWIVSVTDAEQAEAQLLRLVLADPSIHVTHFHRKEYELEDVFLRIVEGGQHGSQ